MLVKRISNADISILSKVDIFFFCIIFVLRYAAFGWWGLFISVFPSFTIGATIVTFILAIIFFLINAKFSIKGSIHWLIFFCAFWVVTKCITTYFVRFDFEELMTVQKYNYIQVVSLALLLPYIQKLSLNKIMALLKMQIYFTFIQFFIYLLQFLGLDLLESRYVEAGGVTLMRSYGFFPDVSLFFPFALIYFIRNNKIGLYYYLVSALCTVLSLGRSQLGQFVILSIICVLLYSIKFKVISPFVRLSAITLIALLLLKIIYPQTVTYWEKNLSNTINSELKNNEGTYTVRKNIIEDAQYNVMKYDAEYFGLGYKRDFDKSVQLNPGKGIHSSVFSQDTSIAGVIYCEGNIGFIIRILPIIFLLIFSIRRLILSKDSTISIIFIVIISTLISESINIVQSTIFTRYMTTMFDMILLYRIYELILKEKKYFSHKNKVILNQL